MLAKISAAEGVGSRFLSASSRQSSRRSWRWRQKQDAASKKRTSPSPFPPSLAAHGDVGQPNNDDVADLVLEEDWRSVRAKLVSKEHGGGVEGLGTSWAHEIAQPEKGCLLVCRRRDLGFFDKAVVFLLSHGARTGDDATSSVGLVLNYPSRSLLQSAFTRGWNPGRFETARIYFGGPLEMNSLHLLHSHGELDKCTEVIDGVYVGGFEAAQAQVEAGQIPPDDFKLLVGYSSWAPYQLAQEIDRKCWFVLSSSKDIILQKSAVDDDSGRVDEALWERVLKLSGLEIPY